MFGRLIFLWINRNSTDFYSQWKSVSFMQPTASKFPMPSPSTMYVVPWCLVLLKTIKSYDSLIAETVYSLLKYLKFGSNIGENFLRFEIIQTNWNWSKTEGTYFVYPLLRKIGRPCLPSSLAIQLLECAKTLIYVYSIPDQRTLGNLIITH